MKLTSSEIKNKKVEKRTFKEKTELAEIQDRLTELELRIEELENGI